MTVLIGSLAGVTTPAVEHLVGPVRPEAARPADGGPGQFSALLAAVVNAGPERARAAGDPEAAGDDAVVEEHEEATNAEETAAPADIRHADRDLERLDPVFRQRLERVIERMESEHGHSVNIVEAHRSQARQDFLYQQGRTRPGNVVTWTRNSNHTQGRAVDVMIDGTYSNRAGYERLAQIAAEEGLHTLGAKDPGHIELPRGAEGSPRLQLASAAASGSVPGAAIPAAVHGPNRVARVAEIARVADVARVAEVARVARPGQAAPPSAPVQQTDPAFVAAAALEAPAVSAGSRGRSGSDRSGREGQSGEGAGAGTSSELQQLRADPGAARILASTSPVTPSAPGGSDAVQRAAQILALKEGAQASVNHLTLRLDAPGGGEDRIRVDLRGSTISTTLSVESAAAADRLASQTPALRHALERHGLDADAVRVRTTHAVAAERLDPLRIPLAAETEAGRQGSQQRSGSEGSAGRDAWKGPHEQQHREHDSRHRSRREQPRRGEE